MVKAQYLYYMFFFLLWPLGSYLIYLDIIKDGVALWWWIESEYGYFSLERNTLNGGVIQRKFEEALVLKYLGLTCKAHIKTIV